MPNTAKAEAIRKAYGEYWNQLDELSQKNALVEYGWLDFEVIRKTGLAELLFNGRITTSIYHIPLENDTIDRDFYRPKSLQGIENNNGWIRIESEEDLPKESGWFEVENNNPDVIFYTSSFAVDLDDLIELYEDGSITHYKRAERSEKPIY